MSDDLGLSLPLDGVVLVEASAGTGKTFVLATLYSRAVIQARLPVDALLAVTFTEAATQELRLRIRERLRLAQRFAEGEAADPQDPKEISTHALVDAALQSGEARTALRARLRAAAEAMDLAPVFTIHQFCRRALAEHALEAGQAPGEVELVANEAALREEIAIDLWRAVCTDAEDARTLAELWKSPAALAEALRELWSVEALLPPPSAVDTDAERALRARFAHGTAMLVTACGRLGEQTCTALRTALATGALHKGTHKPERVERVLAALRAWAEDGGREEPPEDFSVVGSARLAKAVTAKFAGKVTTPKNELTDAVDAWLALRAGLDALAAERRVALVHRLRDEGRERLAALKRRRRQQGFDDLVRDLAEALDGPRGEMLAQRLRAQYRLALVDEFQDTDPRQWAIFRRVFAQAPPDGGPRALFLIGDPKQAIYRFRGGDVFTYLEARETATEAKSLYRNFRSRPRLLRTVQALYAQAGAAPFGQDDIDFVEVDPGGTVGDAALLVDGAVAPALEVLTWSEEDEAALSADAARERAAIACAARIRALLEPGRVRCEGLPLAPGDIAVLVASHREGRLVQRQLLRAGVPSVAAGRDSLYESDEATDLLTVLQACLHLADDARLRAALATPLLGQTAADIARLDEDGERHRAWQDRALAWRQRWERHGPLALVNDLCAAAAPRLLALEDGERRLANWLQLGEALQAECAGRDPAACVRHLAERIARADGGNDEELLRLESDAARVKVLTLHAGKGLEFPLVFLPFLSHAAGSARARDVPMARHHQAGIGRVGQLKDTPGWDAACEAEKHEAAAERLRLLYVGLTRARLATFVGFGPVRDVHRSAFATLLCGGAVAKLDAAQLRARLAALAAAAPEAMVVATAATQLPADTAAPATPPVLPPAAVPQRVLSRDWGVHSFSALVREAGGGETRRAADEAEPVQPASRFAGARFGNVLHAALENVDFAAWRDWPRDEPPPGQGEALEKALREGNWSEAADLDDGTALLARLVRETLNAVLPEGGRLADLSPTARRAELEFHFDLSPTAIDALLALLHAHGLVSERNAFGTRARLEGLLTGFIDLVYERAGRLYLLDYKSNWLPAYDDTALEEAIRHGEYDLQYLLYALALHRWLRLRRPDYDYERDFGGVRYLFCRGLVAGSTQGIFAARPPFALLDALDRLFAGAPL
jgi:exodeoxyribonuclease V beta subunit